MLTDIFKWLSELLSNATFWSAVEAIATVFAAVFVVVQLKHMRSEASVRKAAGMDWLIKFSDSKQFRDPIWRMSDYFLNKKDVESLNSFVEVLAQFRLIRIMIEEGYITEDMLFEIANPQIASVLGYQEGLRDHGMNADILRAISYDPETYELLERINSRHAGLQEKADTWLEQHGDVQTNQ